MLQSQFQDIVKWQKETFNPTTLSCLKHLQEEILEVTFDLKDGDIEKKKSEFADCFILLFGAAALEGMSYYDIVRSVEDKMEINKKRNWSLDKSGKFKHVETEKESSLGGWLRKTRELRLSEDKLADHIGHAETCSYEIYDQLEGEYSDDKAKILYNKWNS